MGAHQGNGQQRARAAPHPTGLGQTTRACGSRTSSPTCNRATTSSPRGTRGRGPGSSDTGRPASAPNGTAIDEKSKKQRTIKASAWLARHAPVEQLGLRAGFEQLVRDRLVSDGGWIDPNGVAVLNLYRPPTRNGRRRKKGPAVDPARPQDLSRRGGPYHQVLAHRAQRPHEKINHCLVLGGLQGIGKHTPARGGQARRRRHGTSRKCRPPRSPAASTVFSKAVVLRISEAKDLGEIDRFKFYDHMKPYLASPPDVLRVDEKYLREHDVFNVCGVVMTTNHKTNGIYQPTTGATSCRLEREDEEISRRLLERISGTGTSAADTVTWPLPIGPARPV